MRRILLSTLALGLAGCSVDLRSEGTPPSNLVPSEALVVVRISSPTSLDQELQGLGIPPSSAILPVLGLPSPPGIDSDRPWYLVWAEDAEKRETPLLLLPLSDAESFQESMKGGSTGYTPRIEGSHVLLGKGTLPELGGSPLAGGFTGDIEAHADLAALRSAYAQEIQQARTSIQAAMDAGLQGGSQVSSHPGLDPAALGEIVQAEFDILFDFLEQSEDLSVSLDLDDGKVDWSLKWALGPATPWGEFVAGQRPKAPTGLGRIDLDQSVVFWTHFDLSGKQELLRTFYGAVSGWMKGMDPEAMARLAGQELEGTMSMGWSREGMNMEAVYTFPDIPISEYRDLMRELMKEAGAEVPGVTREYRPNIRRVGEMEVDLLVQEIQVPGEGFLPVPVNRMQVYYGWGQKEMLTVMRGGGEEEEDGIGRLEALATRPEGPLPERIKPLLDSCPEDLLMFGWMDLGGVLEGLAAMDPNRSGVSFPPGVPPLVFYATARGPQAEYGGSFDLKSIMAAAPAFPGAREGPAAGPSGS